MNWDPPTLIATAPAAARNYPVEPGFRPYPDRFTVKSEGSFIFLRTTDIEWIEAQGDYVKFHAGSHGCMVRMTMKALEDSLDPEKFLRVHRSTVVNIDNIEKISPYRERQYTVVLKSGVRLSISSTYWARIRELYESARP